MATTLMSAGRKDELRALSIAENAVSADGNLTISERRFAEELAKLLNAGV